MQDEIFLLDQVSGGSLFESDILKSVSAPDSNNCSSVGEKSKEKKKDPESKKSMNLGTPRATQSTIITYLSSGARQNMTGLTYSVSEKEHTVVYL